MSINTRLASSLIDMLSRHGFDVLLQYRVDASGDFDTTSVSFTNYATVRAVWYSDGAGDERAADGRPASEAKLYMLISYLDELKDTQRASKYRVVYNGVAYGITGGVVIGDKVAIRLTLMDGVEI
jgi:hypothetical protein